MESARFETEFGRYTTWIAEAIAALAIPDPVPVVCRGTGHPELLDALAGAIAARPGLTILDAGCGMGGPAAWLRRESGCRTVGIDLMEANVRAARRLFGDASAVVATASALPFAEESFDAAWAIGVMEMIDDKPSALSEVARVLKVGGAMAIYTFTSAGELVDPPESDSFVSPDELGAAIASAGLAVVDARPAPIRTPMPDDWRALREAVAEEIRARHSSEREYAQVTAELDRFNRLRTSGLIEAWRFTLRKEAAA